MQKKNLFLVKNQEKGEFNQYWYSQKTIEFLVQQVVNSECQNIAFLSVPSVYQSLPKNSELKKTSYIFEFDENFGKKDQNFQFFDFNNPQDIPDKFNDFFDFVLIDPPFITLDVWSKYAETCKKIIKKQNGQIQGKILLSSIDENKDMLNQLLEVNIKKFRPLIPNLVYQYSLYSNYDDQLLDTDNEEVVM